MSSLNKTTAHDLSAQMSAGQVSSLEVTEAVLDAIETGDGEINAYISVDPKDSIGRVEVTYNKLLEVERDYEAFLKADGKGKLEGETIQAKLEDAAAKGIIPNVDYFAAIVLYQLGVPLSRMTNVVASARIAGWSAHILEQYSNNRLIRPRALYTGHRGRKLPPS